MNLEDVIFLGVSLLLLILVLISIYTEKVRKRFEPALSKD